MRSVIWALILGCILAPSAVGQPAPQDKVLLEYKLLKGLLFRYKVDMDYNAGVQASGRGEQGGLQMHAVVRMRIQRILPDGSAEFTSALESLNYTGDGETEKVDVKKIPVERFVMSKTGSTKWLTEKPTEDTLRGRDAELPIRATLERTDGSVQGLCAAEISMKAGSSPGSVSASTPVAPMTLTAGADFRGKLYFAPEMRCLVQSEGSLTVNMGLIFSPIGEEKESPPSPSEDAKSGGADMMLTMSYKAVLLTN